jgi:hypothetical protein
MATPHFDRALLPPVRGFYEREIGRLSRPSRGWARTTCPFHQGSNKTAFAVNLETGGFYCFNCGVKGGDIVSFVMLRDGLDFVRAAKQLGVWRDQEMSPAEKGKLRQLQRKREQLDSTVVSVEQAECELRTHYRNEIHTLERLQRQTGERMRKSIDSPADIEDCWRVHAEALPRLREAVAAYYLLSFGTVGERIDFTLHPGERDRAIQAAMLRGTVRDDHGVVTAIDFPTDGPTAEASGGVELTFS